ncbi:MAG: hypothetical protein COT14_01555 [Candidatus Diapherotrites archaeon CG08_land_8_20_14_0_20_30_16]|nr:MAG: hypothetical protein COT14_01555 [Candidatus Diapherotrites archaeon CG08_land_8_20_14_0_20_30_16]
MPEPLSRKPISTLNIRKRSVYLNRGEQGEVRSFVDSDPKGKRKINTPFGKKRGQIVKIIYSNGLFRPRIYFNTWLAEARELDSVRKVKLQKEVHSIASILFPDHCVKMPMIRFPQGDFRKIDRDLNKLDPDEVMPELYMEKVDEPQALKDLKQKFYARLKVIQDKMLTASFEERQRLGQELVRLRLESDPLIGRRFSEIYAVEKEIEAAGFDIQHPEVNFGMKNGKVIFYDLIPRLNLDKLRQYVNTNPRLTEKQRRLVLRRIEAVERLGFSKEELWDRRKTYFDSMTRKGLETLKQTLKLPDEPKTREELHRAFYFVFVQDFFEGPFLSKELVIQAINSIQRNRQFVSLNGRTYSVLQLGNKIFLKVNLPNDMINEMMTTDIGIPVVELSTLQDASGRPIGINMLKTKLITLDLNYLIKNRLIDDAQVRQLYT